MQLIIIVLFGLINIGELINAIDKNIWREKSLLPHRLDKDGRKAIGAIELKKNNIPNKNLRVKMEEEDANQWMRIDQYFSSSPCSNSSDTAPAEIIEGVELYTCIEVVHDPPISFEYTVLSGKWDWYFVYVVSHNIYSSRK
jgi:hypothetical protein